MNTYQYQILRYTHDQLTGEFVNVGIVVYCPDLRFLECEVLNKYTRVTSFFHGANGRFILKSLKQFSLAVSKVTRELNYLTPPSFNLEEITSQILLKDNSALTLTEVKKGLDIDMSRCLSQMFKLHIERWQEEQEEHTESDTDVWRHKYKAYFDKYGITNRLTSFEVNTQHDSFSFDKAWKNEVWHCYQPVSFNLQNTDSVKSKVYKWSGKIRELKSSGQKIELTLLTSSFGKQEMDLFISEFLKEESNDISVKIVKDANADLLARSILAEMEAHDNDLQ